MGGGYTGYLIDGLKKLTERERGGGAVTPVVSCALPDYTGFYLAVAGGSRDHFTATRCSLILT